MRKKITLITGAVGEVGLALTKSLAELGVKDLITLDLRSMPAESSKYSLHIQGDILDKSLFARLVSHGPRHGSLFDLAGRVYKNKPAPDNLEVPPHKYLSETRILIGEDTKGA